ncbi:hypothetical protein ACIQC8_08990 [Agrococcus sediminis]|uniref:hypothetical protein n=1 Tax=Agrococcus sediminis TaxID=2599924 RepID=UPI00380FB6D0
MHETRSIRVPLAVVLGLFSATAFAGGIALIAGSLDPSLGLAITPPPELLEGSLFDSYLLPGIVLAVVLGGMHLVACIMVLRRQPHADLAAVAAGFAALIWIFVQMVFIPFSVLQAVYFGAGLLEIGLVLLQLGVLRGERSPRLAG